MTGGDPQTQRGTHRPGREGARNLDLTVDDVVHIFLAFSALDICARNMPGKASETFARENNAHFVKRRANSCRDLAVIEGFLHEPTATVK